MAARWSAMAAICSAIVSLSVFFQDWIAGHLSVRKPSCYWLGYGKTKDTGKDQMYLALPIHALNKRGLSSVLDDLVVRVKNLHSGKTKTFQPLFQMDVSQSGSSDWQDVQLFVPMVIKGQETTSAIVIFQERRFRKDLLQHWSPGEYLIAARDTSRGRSLFKIKANPPESYLTGNGEEFAAKLKNIHFTPRCWSQHILDCRDSIGTEDDWPTLAS